MSYEEEDTYVHAVNVKQIPGRQKFSKGCSAVQLCSIYVPYTTALTFENHWQSVTESCSLKRRVPASSSRYATCMSPNKT